MKKLLALMAALAVGSPALACIPAQGQIVYKKCAANILEMSFVSEVCLGEIQKAGVENPEVFVVSRSQQVGDRVVGVKDVYPVTSKTFDAGYNGINTTTLDALSHVAQITRGGDFAQNSQAIVTTNTVNNTESIRNGENSPSFEGTLIPVPQKRCGAPAPNE